MDVSGAPSVTPGKPERPPPSRDSDASLRPVRAARTFDASRDAPMAELTAPAADPVAPESSMRGRSMLAFLRRARAPLLAALVVAVGVLWWCWREDGDASRATVASSEPPSRED